MHEKSIDKPRSPMASKLAAKLDYEQLTNCMRCGFCLPACPTFRETGIEAESPRGRIALMKAVVDGIMEPDQQFEEQMDHCLGCRACEPACPADVKYGQLIEQTRDAIEEHTDRHRWWVKGIRRTVLKEMFPHQKRMRLLGGALKAYQKTGLRKVAHASGMMKLFPSHLREMENILPDTSYKGVAEKIGVRHLAKGERIATVALFRGCLMDMMFTQTNIHTVKLLTESGFDVLIPVTQNCCGALHAHSGESEEAKSLARVNIRAFKDANVDFIVTNAGGCGAILVEYDHLLHDDPNWKADAKWFAERVIDISDLLVRIGRKLQFSERGKSKAEKALRITYQDSCHLRNVMRASDAPRKLMGEIDGVNYVEMKEADRCCGSAGIYNVTQPEMAGQILEHKMVHANNTQAEYIVTSNPGCLLQMKHGIEKHGSPERVKAVHIVDFLIDRLNID
ncbi:(Fe-S)-binding protein [Paenibacillus sp. TAF43_2]|uniref:(Fe-S)-binding protein n=1 Tax=Paenibacillus sp. TAF43_2 TaxID=3233069 RepID=UPI003F96A8C9